MVIPDDRSTREYLFALPGANLVRRDYLAPGARAAPPVAVRGVGESKAEPAIDKKTVIKNALGTASADVLQVLYQEKEIFLAIGEWVRDEVMAHKGDLKSVKRLIELLDPQVAEAALGAQAIEIIKSKQTLASKAECSGLAVHIVNTCRDRETAAAKQAEENQKRAGSVLQRRSEVIIAQAPLPKEKRTWGEFIKETFCGKGEKER